MSLFYGACTLVFVDQPAMNECHFLSPPIPVVEFFVRMENKLPQMPGLVLSKIEYVMAGEV